MEGKDYLLFDLDGTLTDPKEGITKAVRHALNHYGIQVEDLDTLCPFIGPPLQESFAKYYGFDDQRASEAVWVFREYFDERGWIENVEFPGIKDMLGALQEAGKHLYVATSKPEVFAKRILNHFGMESYFDYIGGAGFDESRVRKAEVIRYVMDQAGIRDVGRTLMIGDREHDIAGAKENKMDGAGVLYGYGSREELEKAGACVIADTVEDLKTILL